MHPYRDDRGSSGVIAYEAGAEHIDVLFRNQSRYRYTYQTPGPEHVEAMKKLASEGQGLAADINRRVRKQYALRLR